MKNLLVASGLILGLASGVSAAERQWDVISRTDDGLRVSVYGAGPGTYGKTVDVTPDGIRGKFRVMTVSFELPKQEKFFSRQFVNIDECKEPVISLRSYLINGIVPKVYTVDVKSEQMSVIAMVAAWACYDYSSSLGETSVSDTTWYLMNLIAGDKFVNAHEIGRPKYVTKNAAGELSFTAYYRYTVYTPNYFWSIYRRATYGTVSVTQKDCEAGIGQINYSLTNHNPSKLDQPVNVQVGFDFSKDVEKSTYSDYIALALCDSKMLSELSIADNAEFRDELKKKIDEIRLQGS